MNEGNIDDLKTFLKAKNFLGILFVLCGFCIAIWVFSNVYHLFNTPESLNTFQEAISDHIESTLTFNNDKIKLVIPPDFLSYLIPIVLLAISISVAGVLITGGVKLLDSDSQLMLRKFNMLKYDIKESIKNNKRN